MNAKPMNALPVPVCVLLESSLNAVLSLDESWHEQANTLLGKLVKLEVTDLQLAFYLFFNDNLKIQVLSYHENPDVLIQASSVNLAKMSMVEDAHAMVLNRDVIITGDVATVAQVEKFFASIEIDWVEHLSRLTGDMVATKVEQAVKSARAWLKQSADSLANNVSEYAQYEAEWLPDQHQVQKFIADVSTLRNDVDRFEARIKRLKHKLKDS